MTAPLLRPFPYAAGHPANHGYVKCSRCGTQRPEMHLAHSAEVSGAYLRYLEGVGEKPELGELECVDRTWCAKQVLAKDAREGVQQPVLCESGPEASP